MIKAELISIGDELLYGQTLDTNSHWISRALDDINIKIYQKTTIGDDSAHILKTLSEAEKRANIILITGGLGPTKDDLTKPLLAKYFDVGFVLNDEALADVTRIFQSLGRELTEVNRKQAELPSNCKMISNRLGTAPGMWFEERGKIFISMPGVPFEMKAMMSEIIVPKLNDKFNDQIIFHKIIRTIGIGESRLAEKIEEWEDALPEDIKLAYLPTFGQVKLRLTGVGTNQKEVEGRVQKQVEKVLPAIKKYVFGFDDEEINSSIGKMLIDRNQTISTAESCTGGFLSSMITEVPGSSAYYKGSVIAYSDEVKKRELGVPAEDILKMGAVSEEVVRKMAEGVRKKLNTDVGLAITGIAGPGGGSPEKPVGTVWLGYADSNKTESKKVQLSKDRKLNVEYASIASLNLFRLNYFSE